MTEQEINAAVNAAINAWIQAHSSEDEQVTSLLSLNEITYSELVNSTLTKLLYLVNGTGSGRDRSVQLSTIRKWILEGTSDASFDNVGVATKFSMTGDPASTEITKGHVNVNTSTKSVDLTTAGLTIDGTIGDNVKTVEIDDESITITVGSKVVEIKKSGITVTDGTNTSELSSSYVSANGFRVKTIISESSDYNGLPKQQLQSGNDKFGDIALVMNTSSSNIKVYISRSSGGGGSDTYVSVNAGCCIQFICISEASANIYSEWAPMSNMQIY